MRAACCGAPADEAGVLAGLGGDGAGSSGSNAAISVCAGDRAPAGDFAVERVEAPAELTLVESPVPVRRSKFSTRRTKFRMIASRCRNSFWSCSTVGLDADLAVLACAAAEPDSVTPNTSDVTAVVLVSTRRACLALNPSSPNLPSVFPPNGERQSSITGALQNHLVLAATYSLFCDRQHARRQSQRVPSAPRSQATCAGTYRSSSSGCPMPGRQPARDSP